MLNSYFARNYAMYAFANQHPAAANLIIPSVHFASGSLHQSGALGLVRSPASSVGPDSDAMDGLCNERLNQRHVKDSRTVPSGKGSPEIKFSIERILSPSGTRMFSEDCEQEAEVNSATNEDVFLRAEHSDGGTEETLRYEWLQCTRYRPPKLQRVRKKDGCKKRKLGRNPRVPFTQHQVAALEQKFYRTHYLSSVDVAELSSALNLTETRVKIWFQNRRARERRDREAKQRTCLDMSPTTSHTLVKVPTVTSADVTSWNHPASSTHSNVLKYHDSMKMGGAAFTPISLQKTFVEKK